MMTGQQLYEHCARGWPHPVGWHKLSDGAKYLWTERANKQGAKHEVHSVQQHPDDTGSSQEV